MRPAVAERVDDRLGISHLPFDCVAVFGGFLRRGEQLHLACAVGERPSSTSIPIEAG